MNKLHESHQIHFFTNNSDVTPTPPIIQSLLAQLGQFNLLPTFGQEINAISGEKWQFIVMLTTDEKIRLEFLSHELIIYGNNLPLDDFFLQAVNILKSLHTIFPNKLSNRLSILSAYVYKGDQAKYKQLYNSIFTYTQADPFEWDNRIVERKEIAGEIINSISNIRRCEIQAPFVNSGALSDCIVFDLDTNTVAQNQSSRFDLKNCETVLNNLRANVKNIIKKLERYTNI